MFDAFNGFNYYHDEGLWNMVLGWLERRKGWKRIDIIQRIYPLTGTFPKAKEIFDTYYNEVNSNLVSYLQTNKYYGDIIWNNCATTHLKK